MSKEFSIKQVSQLLGISTDAIRLYEKEGLVIPHRNASNGYRSYDALMMQRIMIISLYRKLDMSIADIRDILAADNFDTIQRSFRKLIETSTQKMNELQQRINKMTFMESHFDELRDSFGVISTCDFPGFYLIYENKEGRLIANELEPIFKSKDFDYGNLSFICSVENGRAAKRSFCFIILEGLIASTETAAQKDSLTYIEGCRCVSTVVKYPAMTYPAFDLTDLLEYCQANGLTPAGKLYAIFSYSLATDNGMSEDYYNVFLPVV